MFSPMVIAMMMMICEELGVLITWTGRNPFVIYTCIKSPQCILKYFSFVNYISIKLTPPIREAFGRKAGVGAQGTAPGPSWTKVHTCPPGPAPPESLLDATGAGGPWGSGGPRGQLWAESTRPDLKLKFQLNRN